MGQNPISPPQCLVAIPHSPLTFLAAREPPLPPAAMWAACGAPAAAPAGAACPLGRREDARGEEVDEQGPQAAAEAAPS